jgi:endonuclease YncB( thermonuclease family)
LTIVSLALAATLFAACSVSRQNSTAGTPHPVPASPRKPQPAASGPTGRVQRVGDGDTLTVRTANGRDTIVRIQGIDASELGQPFSRISKGNLEELTLGREVEVLGQKTDRFGRTVGRVTVDGKDAGLEMLRRGYAWHFKRYEHEQSEEDRSAYAQAEIAARTQRLGLWRDPAPQPPWEYRDSRHR